MSIWLGSTLLYDLSLGNNSIGLDSERYLEHLVGLAATEKLSMLGRIERIRQAADSLGRRFIKGIGEAQRLYPVTARRKVAHSSGLRRRVGRRPKARAW